MSDLEGQPIFLFHLYRWDGTTPEQFREHYLNHHFHIGRRIPGAAWWWTFLNKNPKREQDGMPVPDAFAVLAFESEEALAAAPQSDTWKAAMEDNVGFTGHFDTYSVERVVVIPEGERQLSS